MELRKRTSLFFFCLWTGLSPAAEPLLRICTYNVESFLDAPVADRPAKSAAARAKVAESLLAAQADVVALQEMGSASALEHLRTTLRARGMDYPYWERVTGADTNIHLAVLSRFPFLARRPHTNDTFLLYGRRYAVSRGFAEVEVEVNPRYRFTLITAHLKSQRRVTYGDEAELREEEARLLRRLITRKLMRNPDLNLVVLGDLNDTKESAPIRLIMGRGKSALVDTRPAEHLGNGPPRPGSSGDPRTVTWTYFFGKEDVYSRIDYILLSQGMAREWVHSLIIPVPDWGVGSDHRPLVATFRPRDG
jgi:endonuclease/exonuclease/phosphatase family metal-dependent hydrolase